MKIAHICLCDPYDEHWAYHRNIISEQNSKDGHETYIITNSYVMGRDGLNGEKKVGHYVNRFGIHVYRLPDRFKAIPKKVQGKINTSSNVYRVLEEIEPDIIMVHNLQTFNLAEIVRYRMSHDVLLLGDSHASLYNSCRSKLSRYFIQGFVFKHWIRKYFSFFDQFYFIGEKEHDFFKIVYGIDVVNYNLLPLPARFLDIERRTSLRDQICMSLDINSDELVFLHSGKLDKGKKTAELLRVLHELPYDFTLVIVGSIPPSNGELLQLISEDPRFRFVGWKNSNELSEYLLVADLYLQPGTPSVTLQNALAVGTPAMVNESSRYYMYYNGWEFVIHDEDDIKTVLLGFFENPATLRDRRACAYNTAKEFFSAEVFAQEMYRLRTIPEYFAQATKRVGCTIISRSTVYDAM